MRIVIVGAGFGGLRLARELNNKKGIDVVLIDRFNYHQFQPLFYQVATAGLDASNISFPLRKIFQKSKNVRVRLGTVDSIEFESREVVTDAERISYDILVLSTGADTNFFGNEELKAKAMPMKSTVEAVRLRHTFLANMEKAVITKDPAERRALMNIVVVGGGPTGVELSGALAEMKRWILPKDYPELDFSEMHIHLIEGLDETLAAMSEKSSAQSAKYLKDLGVELKLNEMVQSYDGKDVTLKSGEKISAATVIWAAGIKGNVPDGIRKELLVKGNRIRVDRYNKVEESSNVYAIGDLAYMETDQYKRGHPQVASVAIQQGKLLAKNILSIQKGEKLEVFEYHDKGSMATVGRNLAVVDIPKPKLHFGGFAAWLVWMGLHLLLLLGVKNRVFVFMNWLYNYFTYDQNLRLIFREFEGPEGEKESIHKQALSNEPADVSA